jgi:hypothetical protein
MGSLRETEEFLFAKIDANLDTNPKIRKAGRDGRDVFEFVLRRIAVLKSAGAISIKNIDISYLAEMLMMSEDEARHGVSRAVTADLLAIDQENGLVIVVGWNDEWGRRPQTTTERKRAERARKKAEIQQSFDVVTNSHADVTFDRDESRMSRRRGEERRGDQMREEESVEPAAPQPVNRTKTGLPDGWKPTETEVNKIAADEARSRGVDLDFELKKFHDHAAGKGWRMKDWDATWRNWTRNAHSRSGPRSNERNVFAEVDAAGAEIIALETARGKP